MMKFLNLFGELNLNGQVGMVKVNWLMFSGNVMKSMTAKTKQK